MPAKRANYSLAERVALGELLALSMMCADAMENSKRSGNEAAEKCNQALGAIVTERAACILRGDAEPREMTEEQILEFIEAWGADEPAAFAKEALETPAPKRKRGKR